MDLQQVAQDETEAFYLFSETYRQMYPPPRKQAVGGLGWQFYLLLITTTASVILASMRTAQQFYKAALLGGSPALAWTEAAMVLLAIEGGIVVYSMVLAVRKKKSSYLQMQTAILVMVLMSMFAGFGQSINLIQNVDPQFLRFFEYALSIVIGLGATIVAWVGGDVLGGQIAMLDIRRQEIDKEYKEEMKPYEAQVRAAWGRSPQRKIVRNDLVVEERSLDVPSFPRNAKRNDPRNLRNYGSHEVKDAMYERIAHVYNTEGRIIGPTELAEAVDTTKSYAHRTIQQWQQEHAEEL